MSIMGTELKTEESNLSACYKKMSTWSDLPVELLEKIGELLPLVELLGFRSACKNWLSASSTASAECEYTNNQAPWFLLYGDASQCRLYQPSSDKVYTIHIPELDGATCIASKDGWLLVVRDTSMFFFCPFSSAKIDLPECPHSNLSDCVAVFSSAPTSPDCVVCVANIISSQMTVNMLRRGANEWTKRSDINAWEWETITCATFHKGFFWLLDSTDKALAVSADNKKSIPYIIRGPSVNDKKVSRLPFSTNREHFHSNLIKKLGMEEGDSLSTCGTVVPGNDYEMYIHNQHFKAADATKECQNKGVWIHPRFFQVQQNQSWAL